MRINHNIAALNTYRQLSTNGANGNKSLEKLSSGLRINKAGDDAAGLAISEKMRGQIRGLDQASRNGQDAISMIQTAEGALTETHSILQRMRELAVQSANGTNTDADRARIQDEITQLTDEINRIGNTTEFNTQKLIDGSKNQTEATAAVKNASSIDKIGAGDNLFEVRAAATAGSGEGLAVTGAVTIHAGTSGKYTSGVTFDDATAASLAAGSNELTVKIGNAVRTITLDDTLTTAADVAADIEGKLQTAFGAAPAGGTDSGTYHAPADVGLISVTGVGNELVITDGGVGAESKIEIVGGNAASILFNASDVAENGNAANNEMTINFTSDSGVTPQTVTFTLDSATYNDASELAAHIEAKTDAALTGIGVDVGEITFSADAVGLGESIKWETATAGKDNGITSITGTAAALAGLTEATITLGEAKNDEITVNVDGDNYTVSIAPTDYSDKDVLANALQTAINAAIIGAGETNTVEVSTLAVADTDRVRFQVTSSTEGAGSSITFSATELASNLGFNTDAVTGQDGQDASVDYQIGANKDQNLSLAIGDMRATALGISGTSAGDSTVTEIDSDVVDVTYGTASTIENGSDTEYVIDVSTAENANKAVEVINNAIEIASKERSKMGAYQNRLQHTINNLGTASENLTAAESRIRDVDMAKEMMEFTKNNILSQAAQAMLAQANQQPQGVLQLLR